MFAKVTFFELRYQLRQPLFWVVTGLFFLFAFGFASSDVVQLGDTSTVHKNSPFAVAMAHMVFALFFMFGGTAVVSSRPGVGTTVTVALPLRRRDG